MLKSVRIRELKWPPQKFHSSVPYLPFRDNPQPHKYNPISTCGPFRHLKTELKAKHLSFSYLCPKVLSSPSSIISRTPPQNILQLINILWKLKYQEPATSLTNMERNGVNIQCVQDVSGSGWVGLFWLSTNCLRGQQGSPAPIRFTGKINMEIRKQELGSHGNLEMD